MKRNGWKSLSQAGSISEFYSFSLGNPRSTGGQFWKFFPVKYSLIACKQSR